MLLSIIIPYYDTYEYTKELLDVLIPQLTDKVEVFIIDDGCNDTRLNDYIYQDKFKEHWNSIRVWHLPTNSGGASKPRNVGLDFATGEYIAFIDSDDMVSNDYVKCILEKLGTDLIYISWKSDKHNVVIVNKPPKWNCSVWSRVYRRELIGDIRFNEELKIAEDWVFINQIEYKTFTSVIKQIYIYNLREGSLIRSLK